MQPKFHLQLLAAVQTVCLGRPAAVQCPNPDSDVKNESSLADDGEQQSTNHLRTLRAARIRTENHTYNVTVELRLNELNNIIRHMPMPVAG